MPIKFPDTKEFEIRLEVFQALEKDTPLVLDTSSVTTQQSTLLPQIYKHEARIVSRCEDAIMGLSHTWEKYIRQKIQEDCPKTYRRLFRRNKDGWATNILKRLFGKTESFSMRTDFGDTYYVRKLANTLKHDGKATSELTDKDPDLFPENTKLKITTKHVAWCFDIIRKELDKLRAEVNIDYS